MKRTSQYVTKQKAYSKQSPIDKHVYALHKYVGIMNQIPIIQLRCSGK